MSTLVRVGSVFARLSAGDAIGRYRRAARDEALGRYGILTGWVIRLFASLAWPVIALFEAVSVNGWMRSRGEPGVGADMILTMWRFALGHNAPPYEFAIYGFHRPERRDDASQYVFRPDHNGLGLLNAWRGGDNSEVQDKHRFATICGRHGLPAIPTVAVFAGGRRVDLAGEFFPDADRLWVKALTLDRSAGAALWRREGACYRDHDGRLIPASELADHLAINDCIIQPVVENHPDLARLGGDALASLRVVTGLEPGGEARLIAACITLSRAGRLTSHGGVNCGLDGATGRILTAFRRLSNAVSVHPDTGASLVGETVPHWHAALELALRAHAEAFPRFATLGWDIALTSDGPVLIEANSGWDERQVQIAHGPLGRTAFGSLLDQYG